MKKQRKDKATTTQPTQDEQEDIETRNLLSPYIPPRRMDAPQVSIPSKNYATLVAPKRPKGMTVLHDILPNLVKLSFEDSDTSKINDHDRNNYMKLMRDTLYSSNCFIAMQWEKGLE